MYQYAISQVTFENYCSNKGINLYFEVWKIIHSKYPQNPTCTSKFNQTCLKHLWKGPKLHVIAEGMFSLHMSVYTKNASFRYEILALKDRFLLIPIQPIALRKAKIVYNFGLSESNRVNIDWLIYLPCMALYCIGVMCS